MAVSNRALGGLAVLALGSVLVAIAPWLTPTVRSLLRPASVQRTQVRALADSVNHLRLREGASRIRSEIDSALHSYQLGGIPDVIVLGGGPAVEMRASAERLLDSLSLRGDSAMPVRIVLVNPVAMGTSRSGSYSSVTLLPDQREGAGCTIVRVVFPQDTVEVGQFRGWLSMPWYGTDGPCWYLARFGMPGPAVRSWLDSRYWDVAETVPPSPGPIFSWDEIKGRVDPAMRMVGDMHGAFAGGSVMLQGCAHDRPELCEAALLSPLRGDLLPPNTAANHSLAAYATGYRLFGLPPEASWSLLARMVDDLGPARFAAFWTSRHSVPEAFQAASGMPLGRWYREQLRRELRQADVEDAGEGPYWPSTIIFFVLALAIALSQAERRQVP